MLRSRTSRREEPLGRARARSDRQPRRTIRSSEALLADSVGLALLVVLETLPPAERLAFVLHDMFAMPFEEIAPIVERSPTAARQLASRARRRVQGAADCPTSTSTASAQVVDAFLAASRGGDFDALLAVLDPDVVLRVDRGGQKRGELRGAETVAKQSLLFRRSAPDRVERRATVNGAPGVVALRRRAPFSVLGFTVVDGKIVEIDILADPERLARLDLTLLDG